MRQKPNFNRVRKLAEIATITATQAVLAASPFERRLAGDVKQWCVSEASAEIGRDMKAPADVMEWLDKKTSRGRSRPSHRGSIYRAYGKG